MDRVYARHFQQRMIQLQIAISFSTFRAGAHIYVCSQHVNAHICTVNTNFRHFLTGYRFSQLQKSFSGKIFHFRSISTPGAGKKGPNLFNNPSHLVRLPNTPLTGRTDERMDGRTENLPILQDFVPYRGRCPASIEITKKETIKKQ